MLPPPPPPPPPQQQQAQFQLVQQQPQPQPQLQLVAVNPGGAGGGQTNFVLGRGASQATGAAAGLAGQTVQATLANGQVVNIPLGALTG